MKGSRELCSEEKRYQLIKKLSQYDRTRLLGMYERVQYQIEACENGTSFSDAHWCGDTLIDFFENYGINCESEKRDQEQFENGGSGSDYFFCAQELLIVIEEIQSRYDIQLANKDKLVEKYRM